MPQTEKTIQIVKTSEQLQQESQQQLEVLLSDFDPKADYTELKI